MDAKYFEDGNNIYECKSSPSQMGGIVSAVYIKTSVDRLIDRWKKNGKTPSGYRYLFPVNYLDDKGKEHIARLQKEYPNVSIEYYEKDKIDKLISQLEKVKRNGDLVDYIRQVMNQ